MKILGLNIPWPRANQKSNSDPPASGGTAQKRYTPEALAWLRDDHPGSRFMPLRSPYEQVAWVYRAVNVLAEQVANTPFVFSTGERGQENLITSGPLPDFYDQPNPHIDRFQYWELRVLWLLLRGECFRVPIYRNPDGTRTHYPTIPHSYLRDPHSTLQAVLILNPDNFREIVEHHELVGWRYTGSPMLTPLETQVLLPEEVWFEKLPNPFDFWRGLSPLGLAMAAATTDFAAAAFMRGFIENNADSGLIVRTDEHLDDSQKEQLLAALRSRKRAAGTADRPLLLWSTCEIVKPTLSAADFQFLENRTFSRSEICAALGVPEEIVASTDHNKYDVMEGARLNFIENRIAPLCARLEAAERRTIKALDPNAVGWFDLDSLPIMQAARRTRLAAAKTGFDMGIPFNELNRVLDLGFQRLPWGDRGFLPRNLAEVGNAEGEAE